MNHTPLKDLHDQLLALKPEDASHDVDSCDFCLGSTGEAASDSAPGGSVSDKTYTEDEYNALLAKVEDLKGKVDELTASAEASTVDAAVASVKTELEAQIADLQTQLDTAVLEASTQTAKYDELVAFLEATETAAREAAELEARKEARIAAVKEVASFPDAYLEDNADRFAAMSDETFELALEGFKAIETAAASSTSSKKDDEIPAVTAMTAARSNDAKSSPLSEVLNLRFAGVDTRSI